MCLRGGGTIVEGGELTTKIRRTQKFVRSFQAGGQRYCRYLVAGTPRGLLGDLRAFVVKERLASRFDLRQFHRVLLEAGGMPLDLLERRVLAWIDELIELQPAG